MVLEEREGDRCALESHRNKVSFSGAFIWDSPNDLEKRLAEVGAALKATCGGGRNSKKKQAKLREATTINERVSLQVK